VVLINWQPCRFGGHRPWWECPWCHRRVTKLYGAGDRRRSVPRSTEVHATTTYARLRRAHDIAVAQSTRGLWRTAIAIQRWFGKR
jgi:hypothetical protein